MVLTFQFFIFNNFVHVISIFVVSHKKRGPTNRNCHCLFVRSEQNEKTVRMSQLGVIVVEFNQKPIISNHLMKLYFDVDLFSLSMNTLHRILCRKYAFAQSYKHTHLYTLSKAVWRQKYTQRRHTFRLSYAFLFEHTRPMSTTDLNGMCVLRLCVCIYLHIHCDQLTVYLWFVALEKKTKSIWTFASVATKAT